MTIRTLFLKIFIRFWLAAAGIIGVLVLMAWISDAQTLPERITRGPLSEVLNMYADSAARAYEQEGIQGLEQFIRKSTKDTGTEVYVYDFDGKAITAPGADNVPDVVKEVQSLQQSQRITRAYLGRTTWGKMVTGPGGKCKSRLGNPCRRLHEGPVVEQKAAPHVTRSEIRLPPKREAMVVSGMLW